MRHPWLLRNDDCRSARSFLCWLLSSCLLHHFLLAFLLLAWPWLLSPFSKLSVLPVVLSMSSLLLLFLFQKQTAVATFPRSRIIALSLLACAARRIKFFQKASRSSALCPRLRKSASSTVSSHSTRKSKKGRSYRHGTVIDYSSFV